MSLNTVSVPGKVMLTGEYAVLAGGSALMLPVKNTRLVMSDRGETRSLYSSKVTQTALKLSLPDIEDFETGNELTSVYADSRSFYSPRGKKLGVGLSAAEAVAAVSLRFARAGVDPASIRGLIARYALEAHRIAQGGLGSGADVYCCAYNAPIIYQRSHDLRGPGVSEPEKTPDIPLYLAYAGHGSDTREAVTAFESWSNRDGALNRMRLRKLVELSDQLADIWVNFDRRAFFAAVDEYTYIMRVIARAAGISYWIDTHDEINSWARRFNALAKPVGAGGGDMVLIIGEVPIEQIASSGYSPCFKIEIAGRPEAIGFAA